MASLKTPPPPKSTKKKPQHQNPLKNNIDIAQLKKQVQQKNSLHRGNTATNSKRNSDITGFNGNTGNTDSRGNTGITDFSASDIQLDTYSQFLKRDLTAGNQNFSMTQPAEAKDFG